MTPKPTRWQRLRAWLRGLPVVCIQTEDGQVSFTVPVWVCAHCYAEHPNSVDKCPCWARLSRETGRAFE